MATIGEICTELLKHPLAYHIGQQEGTNNVKPYEVGQCLTCATSFNLDMDKYDKIEDFYIVHINKSQDLDTDLYRQYPIYKRRNDEESRFS